MRSIIHWLENHLMACPYKAVSGIDCPGCGMQRSFIELLKGEFLSSLQLYPPLIPVIITLLFTGLHLFFKFKKGAVIIKYSFISTVGIVFFNYLLKLFL